MHTSILFLIIYEILSFFVNLLFWIKKIQTFYDNLMFLTLYNSCSVSSTLLKNPYI